MFLLYAVAIGVALGLLLGGRLQGIASLELAWGRLMIAALLAQVALFSDPVAGRVGDLGPVLYVGTTALVLAALVRNRRLHGVPIVLLGAASNMAAIVANGGYMPASPAAMAALGKTVPGVYSNSAMVTEPALPWLTDLFALPRWLPGANVFSLGDVLIGAGVATVIVLAMRRPVAAGAPAH